MLPVLFTLPNGHPVFSYGVMLGLSCVIGAHLAVYLSRRSGIEERRAWWMVLTVIVVGLVGGRVHDLIVNGRPFSELFQLTHSGRTAYGAFVSATLAGIVAARLYKVPFWRFGDAAAPTMALGLGLTRVGCFLYGCDYGYVTDDWGVRFPTGSPAYEDHLARGLVAEGGTSLPVFPVQLPASVVGLGLGAFLIWLWFRQPRREGTVLLGFGLGYGLARACLEQFRDDAGRGTLLGLSTSTTIGLGTALLSLAFLTVPQLRALRPPAAPPLPHDAVPEGPPEPKGKA
ncbi:MAG: prolipoprotein diacylglyceryl transferase [Planctomycetota bacterium]